MLRIRCNGAGVYPDIANAQFVYKSTANDSTTWEVTGKLKEFPYAICLSKIQRQVTATPESVPKTKSHLAVPQKATKSFSCRETTRKSLQVFDGPFFFNKAVVERICCDQLRSLELHKERSVGNKERSQAVVRRFHKVGGWIRLGRNKDRIYVAPGSPLPEYLEPKRPKVPSVSDSMKLNL